MSPPSGWPAADLPGLAPVAGSTEADVVVIGGGLAGLATALAVVERRPDWRVVVAEARRVSAGATGASSGMVGPGMGGWLTANRKRHGDATAKAQFAATLEAVRAVTQLVAELGVDCELEAMPQYRVARTGREAQRLEDEAAGYAALGFDVPLVRPADPEGGDLPASVRSALLFREAAVVNPRLLCVGLAGALVQRGVTIHEESRALSVEADAVGQRVAFGAGEVRCRHVVVATDAYTAQLGYWPGRIVPLHSHILMTPPLDQATRARLGWTGRGAVVGSCNFFNYFRLTSRDELVFGGGPPTYGPHRDDRRAGATEQFSTDVARQVVAELAGWFPVLAGADGVTTWSGPMGFTIDRLPLVGRLPGPGSVFVSGAWCGHGLALSVWAGQRLAELIDGASARADVALATCSPTRRLPRLPADPWRAFGLRRYLGYLAWRDRRDRPAPVDQGVEVRA